MLWKFAFFYLKIKYALPYLLSPDSDNRNVILPSIRHYIINFYLLCFLIIPLMLRLISHMQYWPNGKFASIRFQFLH